MANFNLNTVILGGRVTSAPELKTTPNGVSVCSFTIAINRKVNRNETDFINCVAWRQTAEFVSKYFGKGSAICVIGEIQTRSWDDQQGNKRYATEVIVNEAKFVDSKTDSTAPASAPPSASPTEFDVIKDEDDLPF